MGGGGGQSILKSSAAGTYCTGACHIMSCQQEVLWRRARAEANAEEENKSASRQVCKYELNMAANDNKVIIKWLTAKWRVGLVTAHHVAPDY